MASPQPLVTQPTPMGSHVKGGVIRPSTSVLVRSVVEMLLQILLLHFLKPDVNVLVSIVSNLPQLEVISHTVFLEKFLYI